MLVLCVLLLRWVRNELTESTGTLTSTVQRGVGSLLGREQKLKVFKISWMFLKEDYWGEGRPYAPWVLLKSKYLWFYDFYFGTWLRFLDFISTVFFYSLIIHTLKIFYSCYCFLVLFSFMVWCAFASFLLYAFTTGQLPSDLQSFH